MAGAIDLDRRLRRAWMTHDDDLADYSLDLFQLKLRFAVEQLKDPARPVRTQDAAWQDRLAAVAQNVKQG